VYACSKFRTLILGYLVFVWTDHQALTFLFRCRLRNARLTCWTLALQEFDLRIQHIPKPTNIIDFLSRNPPDRDSYQQNQKTNYILALVTDPMASEINRHLQILENIVKNQHVD